MMNELCDRSFSYTCFVVLSVLHSAATAKHPRGPASINSTYRVAAARCPHLASGRHSPRQSLARRGRQPQRDAPPRTAPPHPGASAEPRIARIRPRVQVADPKCAQTRLRAAAGPAGPVAHRHHSRASPRRGRPVPRKISSMDHPPKCPGAHWRQQRPRGDLFMLFTGALLGS